MQFSRNITHMRGLAVGAASIRFNRREFCLVDPGNPSWEGNLTFIIFHPIGKYIHKWVSHHLFPFTTTSYNNIRMNHHSFPRMWFHFHNIITSPHPISPSIGNPRFRITESEPQNLANIAWSSATIKWCNEVLVREPMGSHGGHEG